MNKDAVVVDVLRSPMARGKRGGALSQLHPVDLLAQMLKALVGRNDLDPATVEDVLVGCVSQVGDQAANPGRVAWLAAGFPEQVPGATIERRCGSGQQAIHFAAQGVMAGVYDVVIAGGVESMSRVPMGVARLDSDPFGPGMQARYAPGLIPQGISAELVSRKWGIDREALDAFSVRSHRLAAAAQDIMASSGEMIPVELDHGVVVADETVRPATSIDGLAKLQSAFRQPTYEARFPGLDWSTTAGNSSQLADGAAVALIMSETRARQLGLRPRARFVAFDVMGGDPVEMLSSPAPSSKRMLGKLGLSPERIDHYEVNEAFACVPLAWCKDLDADPDRLNPCGGAIALGHPLGASGGRLLATMLNAMERSGGRYGLQTMCAAGGMATTMLIERN